MCCNCKSMNIGTLYQDGSILPNPDFHMTDDHNIRHGNYPAPAIPFIVHGDDNEVIAKMSPEGELWVKSGSEDEAAKKFVMAVKYHWNDVKDVNQLRKENARLRALGE